MLNRFKKYNQKRVYIEITLFVSILGSLLGVFYYYQNHLISKLYEDRINFVAKEHKIILENEFIDIKSDIDYLASKVVLKLLKSNDENIKQKIRTNFFHYIKAKDKYDQLRIVNKEGQEIIRVEIKGKVAEIIMDDKLQNKRDRYYIKDALKLKPNEIYISYLDLNQENGQLEIPIKPMIRFVKPIFDTENVLYGFVIFNYKAKKFLNRIQKSVDENRLMLSFLNNNSEIMLYKNSAFNWAFMYEDRKITKFSQLNSELWEKRDTETNKILPETNNLYFISSYFPYKLLLHNDDYIVSDNTKKWYIILSKNWDEIHQQSLKELYKLIPFFVIILITGIVTILKLADFRRDLQKEEEKTRLATITFRNTSQGIMISNEKNIIVEINKAFSEITGYSSEEVLGKTPSFLKSRKTKNNVYRELKNELFETNIWEGTLWNRRKNGDEYPILAKINLFKDEKQKVKNYITVFSDISEQIAIEKNLRLKNQEITESKEQVEKSMEELKSAQSQLIQSEKLAALGQLIASVAHEINTPLGAINSSAANISNALDNILIKTLNVVSELPKDIKEVFIEIVSSNLHPTNIIDLQKQRAEKKELMAKLNEQDIVNSRRVADIIVSANLVDKIEVLIPLIKSQYSQEVLESISKINSIILNTKNISLAVSKSSRIVKALKNFSHQNIDDALVLGKISEGIETVLVVYHNQIKREIILTKDYGEYSPIMCYFDELNQVWTNIIQNAIQSMNYVGNIDISISEDDKYQIVKITDSGIGMSKELQEKIFEPFYTTKARGEGTGLGLDIVKKIIDKHNGKIEVESEVGVGSTFTIFIDKHLKDNNE